MSMGKETVLVTGGSGFFGSILKERLLKEDFKVVSIDIEKDDFAHPDFTAIQGDIASPEKVEPLFLQYNFSAVFHLSAMLAHEVKDKAVLWRSNVEGTRVLAEMAAKYHVPRIIFTSSNCLWGKSFSRPVTEEDEPAPIEIYGRSKLEAEK